MNKVLVARLVVVVTQKLNMLVSGRKFKEDNERKRVRVEGYFDRQVRRAYRLQLSDIFLEAIDLALILKHQASCT